MRAIADEAERGGGGGGKGIAKWEPPSLRLDPTENTKNTKEAAVPDHSIFVSIDFCSENIIGPKNIVAIFFPYSFFLEA